MVDRKLQPDSNTNPKTANPTNAVRAVTICRPLLSRRS